MPITLRGQVLYLMTEMRDEIHKISNILVNQLLLMMLLMCSSPNRFKLLLVIQGRSALRSFTTKHQVRLEIYTLSCLKL